MPAARPGGPPGEGLATDTAALRALLSETRLVTVTGPPGCGKSELAEAAAAAARADFPDGTWTVPLRAVTDGALVAVAVGRTLRLPDRQWLSQLTTLRAGLRGKRLLIVLDDCDQVSDACADLAAGLAQCPGVHLAATASAPLRVPGERVYPARPGLAAVGGQARAGLPAGQ